MKKKRFTRRSFLADAARWLPGAYLLGCAPKTVRPFSSRGPASDDNLFDCIVIGAGVSGLTVAHDLQPLKVVVLEGANRIGGRVCTNRTTFGMPVELGAEYVHLTRSKAMVW